MGSRGEVEALAPFKAYLYQPRKKKVKAQPVCEKLSLFIMGTLLSALMTHMGRKSKEERIYVYIRLIHQAPLVAQL